MAILRHKLLLPTLLFISLTQTGCMMTYLMQSGYEQGRLLRSRTPIKDASTKYNLTAEDQRKLALVGEAREFAQNELGLKDTDNYKTYVQLDRSHVSYIVQAASAWELKAYTWWFPIVGDVPYLGFFSPEQAKNKAKDFDPKKYDTYVRGVSAYSTLGWFDDPILSSMLKYEDYDLVDVVIHETVHATLYIKSNADFNEQLATFLGQYGAELFYRKKEGDKSKTVAIMRGSIEDKKIFSEFIEKELKELEEWYKIEDRSKNPETKAKRITEIQDRFKSQILPKLKTKDFEFFGREGLNNASLLALRTYYVDMSIFEAVLKKHAGQFKSMIDALKTLENSKDPKADLQKLL